MAGAEFAQARCRRRAAAASGPHVPVERRRIAGAVGFLDRFEIDLRHCVASTSDLP